MGKDGNSGFDMPGPLWFIGTGFLLLLFWMAISSPKNSEDRVAAYCLDGGGAQKAMAVIAAEQAVETRLEYAGSARFPGLPEILHRGDCEFDVIGIVDAANAMGAKRRLAYQVRLHYVAGPDRWDALEVKLARR
jgi:hypothetical protein